MNRLALFDLDYTLLPLDSDYEFGRFLGRIGVVDSADHERRNQQFYDQYKAGTLDIQAYLDFALAPFKGRDADELRGWQERFMTEVIEPGVTDRARELVEKHRSRGDLCAIVTATNDVVTGPIAALFGIDHLIATRCERIDDRHTGRCDGLPSFREGKIVRVDDWLETRGTHWQDFDETWFYSDSMNDLPLLERASHPVATNPDPTLRRIATERRWPVIELFQA